jgi:diacylglycerol kinase family enzyme
LIAVIINPISGAGRRPDVARQRAERATAFLHSRRVDGEVFVTERAGHARELTMAALGRGASLCVAWGGDGTVNEVASALAFTEASLAIVPSGSGNGLSREVGIPFDTQAAFEIAVGGRDRVIDAGEIEGRLFFNLAGVGLDARRRASVRRHRPHAPGFRALSRNRRQRDLHQVAARVRDHDRWNAPAIARACSPRSPTDVSMERRAHRADARIDDGKLDVVVVDDRSPWAVLRHAPKLFRGKLAEVPGVTMSVATRVEIASPEPLIYHVDGEPCAGGSTVSARIRPGAVRVRVGNLCA